MNQPDPRPRWQDVYEGLAGRAREILDDTPRLEKIIDLADKRAEGFKGLREELAPLRRLVISYMRGSYRDSRRRELSLAV